MVEIKNLTFRYQSRTAPILKDLCLDAAPGEIVALTGGSGSGKTTLLRILAGLEEPEAGSVLLEGQVLVDQGKPKVLPEHRGIGLMFQDLALFPHMTVWENARFGVHTTSDQEILVLLALTDLKVLKDRYPHQLSGGQRQRLALVRALAGRPRLLLLDEPFNNLDRRLTEELSKEFRSLIKARGVGALVVTHEKDQAYMLADRIAFLEEGHVSQIDTPEAFYRSPKTVKAARFGGPLNLCALGRSPLGRRLAPSAPEGWLALRPENLKIGIKGPGQEVQITDVRFHGRDWVVTVKWPEGDTWTAYSPEPLPGGRGFLSWEKDVQMLLAR